MIRSRVVRAIPGSWSGLALVTAALVVIASGFAFGASMAIGIQ